MSDSEVRAILDHCNNINECKIWKWNEDMTSNTLKMRAIRKVLCSKKPWVTKGNVETVKRLGKLWFDPNRKIALSS